MHHLPGFLRNSLQSIRYLWIFFSRNFKYRIEISQGLRF